jgi:alpha-glutamyl/putrescinyl thymine pyrophosphorylase clade 1
MLADNPFIPERIEEWAYWISAREAIRKRKADPKKTFPYSADPVMAGTRWCNVRRMDDKVSLWLMENWYPDSAGRDLLHIRQVVAAALAARMINRPETLAHITSGGRFNGFDYKLYLKRMYEVKDGGGVVFTNAYIINGASGGPKIEQVLNAIQKCVATKPFHYVDYNSMQATAKHLHALPGIGGFMAGQVVADLRWVLDDPSFWRDRMTWAPPGPGSSRGMKYLLGLSSPDDMAGRGKDLSELQFLRYLPALIKIARTHRVVGPIFKERKLEAHDIQNTLCELGKYVRVKNGGHAKNNYPPKA